MQFQHVDNVKTVIIHDIPWVKKSFLSFVQDRIYLFDLFLVIMN